MVSLALVLMQWYREPTPPQLTNGHLLERVSIGYVGYIHEGRFKILFDAGEELGFRRRGTDVPNCFSHNPLIAAERQNPLVKKSRPAGTEFWGFEKRSGISASASVSVYVPSFSIALSQNS
jgi:hypothetical protein